VVVENGEGSREERRSRALGRALGADAVLYRRPDGKPEVPDGPHVSVSHADPLTLLAVSGGPVGCDMERRPQAPGDWSSRLDAARWDLARVIARAAGEDEGTAALRVWTVLESLKKAGHAPGTPLVLSRTESDGWVLLGAGRSAAATWTPSGPAGTDGLVVGFLVTPSDP
jgi:enediyne polyketide synthase